MSRRKAPLAGFTDEHPCTQQAPGDALNVAVIGAGVAGLGAARELLARGAQVTVYERESTPGGRAATEEVGGYVFDSGAQSIAPYDSELTGVLTSGLDTTDLVQIQTPIFVHQHLRVMPGDPKRSATARYTYRQGLAELPRLLAEGINIRFGSNVTQIERANGVFSIQGDPFDAVVTAVPVPQAAVLLWGIDAHKPIAQSRYRTCLAVLLGFELEAPTARYHAIVTEEESHPLQWLSLESVKCPGRSRPGTTAMVAQLSPGFSRMAWDWEDERIVSETVGYVTTLFGREWMRPPVSRVKRWKYSQPEAIALFDSVNHRGDRLIVAGDGVVGGRIEYAFASGLRAARLLTDER